jgi:hypothetical protein
MSWASRELRKEARGYFFANNAFKVRGSDGASSTAFLGKLGQEGRASIANLSLAGTRFWMYNSLFHVCHELTSLCNLNIYMDIGHLIKFELYTVTRTCVLQNEPKFQDLPALVIHRNIALFAQLPALQTLNIKCAVPGWGTYCDRPRRDRQEKVCELVKGFVLEEVQKSLQGRSVEVVVAIVSAGIALLKDGATGEYL